MILIYIAPLFIIFEMVQLVVAERYIGIKQIRAGKHPLESVSKGLSWLAAVWLLSLFFYWAYMLALVLNPLGSLQGLIMIAISLAGVGLRRTLGMKWALVIMTIEGAVRMGLLTNLLLSVVFYGSRFSNWSL